MKIKIRTVLISSSLLFFIFVFHMTGGTGFSESVFILQPNLKVVKYKAVTSPNTVVTKPVCPAGWAAEIFVTPAVISGYSTAAGNALNTIAMAQAYAHDNGNGTWTALMQLKDSAGNLLTGSGDGSILQIMIETMCCPAGGNCI